MLQPITDLFFTNRFYLGIVSIILLFVLAGFFPFLFFISIAILCLFLLWFIIELVFLFRTRNGFFAKRLVPDKLSNGDENEIFIDLQNRYPFPVHARIIDEVPFQFQVRDSAWHEELNVNESKTLLYQLKPVKRGEYSFGAVNIYASSFLRLVERRYRFDNEKLVPVYPSFLQMRKYELAAFSNYLEEFGIKKQRRLGQTMEFEQIKDYVQGDDFRSVNWKASARRNALMVNQYQEEKSQQVYAIIDKGRLMKMPFDNLSLLDYSINASLVLLNIALKKGDKSGLISFSNKMSSVVKADKKPGQLAKLLESLYAQKTKYLESNFELLSAFIRRRVSQRSLLLLFTNFESVHSFERQQAYFRLLAKRHVLVIIFFKNTGLDKIKNDAPETVQEIYTQTIAEKYINEKYLIVKRLQQNGIYSILTEPKDLTINTINKYLELKARGIV